MQAADLAAAADVGLAPSSGSVHYVSFHVTILRFRKSKRTIAAQSLAGATGADLYKYVIAVVAVLTATVLLKCFH